MGQNVQRPCEESVAIAWSPSYWSEHPHAFTVFAIVKEREVEVYTKRWSVKVANAQMTVKEGGGNVYRIESGGLMEDLEFSYATTGLK